MSQNGWESTRAPDAWFEENKGHSKTHLTSLRTGDSLYAGLHDILREFLVHIPCHLVRALSLSCFHGCNAEAVLLRHFFGVEYLRIFNEAKRFTYKGRSLCSGIVMSDMAVQLDLPRVVILDLLGISVEQKHQLAVQMPHENLLVELEQWRVWMPCVTEHSTRIGVVGRSSMPTKTGMQPEMY